MDYRFDEPVTSFKPPRSHMEFSLKDPQVVLGYLMNLCETLYESDIKLEGVMFGATDYFTLRNMANNRGVWAGGQLSINDVKIMLDPMRDEGAPVAVFNETEAIKVLSMRKT